MNLNAIEIPIGTSRSGETISVQLTIPGRNHCFIVGGVGSGKSMLLKVIIDSVSRDYNTSQVIVWTDYYSHNYTKCMNASVLEVILPESNAEERTITLLERLYHEAQNRIQILQSTDLQLHQIDSMPWLIAIIDDFYPFDCYSDRGRIAAERLSSILRMSHAIGISLICASQLPVSRLCCWSFPISDFFNLRIALRSSQNEIPEALGIDQSMISTEINKAIDNLSSSRRPGDFLFYNRYDRESLISGRVMFQAEC